MQSLGLKPTKNSGSGWIEKEDGQNDFVICQLKSTDAQSIKVNQKDIRVLEYNASVCHKLPLFAIQFLNTGEVWLLVKPDDITSVTEFLETGKTNVQSLIDIDLSGCKESKTTVSKKVGSSSKARESFHKQIEKKYYKDKSAR